MTPRPQTAPSLNGDTDIEAEKAQVVYTESIRNGDMSEEEAAFLSSFTDERRREIVRKVDWRLVPMLLILYLISFIDRANIGRHFPRQSVPPY